MKASSSSIQSTATLAVRLLGLALCVLGLWQGTANLIDGWIEFDPTYLGYFLRSQLLRPGLAVLLGLLLLAGSKFLARFLTRGLHAS